MFYLDDGLMLGPLDQVREAFRLLTQQFAMVGLKVNTGKCVFWGPGCSSLEDPDQAPSDPL